MSKRSSLTGRFLKGHSGNPKGRPRNRKARTGSTTCSPFDIVFEKRYSVVQGGVKQDLPVEKVLQRRIFEQALAGKRAAQRAILRMIMKRDKVRAERNPRSSTSVTQDYHTEPRNADAAMCLLGIAAPDALETGDNSLRLEPWPVQEAIRRRQGRKRLTGHDISAIERVTRAPESLRWPRGAVR